MKEFDPLIFLMSLGAGGISVIPFAFFQYSQSHGKGLIEHSQVDHASGGLAFFALESVMVIFALLHVVLTIVLLLRLQGWKKESYESLLENPLANAAILAPFISVIMTMNVFIGPLRYFIPAFADNLQMMMLPALLFWSLLWFLLIRTDIRILKKSFENNFDVGKISFGWLLHPFALGMLSVTGSGIAVMAHDPAIAHTAAFMSMVSATMGFFLLVVKLISIFKSHFDAPSMPGRQFLPSFLIVIPNITLFAITAFRLGHYLEHNFQFDLGPFFLLVIGIAFAFETWYLLFGISLLKEYFKKHFTREEFYLSQWGLVCPFVAYAVLASFAFGAFLPSVFFIAAMAFGLVASIALFWILFVRQLKCSCLLGGEIDCR
jgi:hypothetical protein